MNGDAFDAFLAQAQHAIDAAPASACELTPLLRRVLRDALARPAFTAACVLRAADALEATARTRFPTIHRDDARALRIRLFGWPPRQGHPPHRHAHWTVTGVLHGRLVFRSYHDDGAADRPGAPHKHIDAAPGDVGMICTPCWHDVANPCDDAALSIHLFHCPPETAPQSKAPLAATPAARDRLLALCAQALGSWAGRHDRSDADADALNAALHRVRALGGPLAQRAAERATAALG